jgi:transcriptional regulator with XRE-family HTH domain
MAPRPRRGLIAARKRAEHSHASLAKAVGVHKTTVSRLERRVLTVSDRHLNPLDAALRIPLFEVLVLLNDPAAGRGQDDTLQPHGGHRSTLDDMTPATRDVPFHQMDQNGQEPGVALWVPKPFGPLVVDLLAELRTDLAQTVGAVATVDDGSKPSTNSPAYCASCRPDSSSTTSAPRSPI